MSPTCTAWPSRAANIREPAICCPGHPRESPDNPPHGAAAMLFKVALLHLAPKAGDLAYNRLLIEQAIVKSAAEGCDWIVTPELAVSGYTFVPVIGTAWISAQPDPWMD